MSFGMYKRYSKHCLLVTSLLALLLVLSGASTPSNSLQNSLLSESECVAGNRLMDKIFKEEKFNKIVNFIKNRKAKV